MTKTDAINRFLTTFNQETMTTAEQILAVDQFYDMVEREGFNRGYHAGTKMVSQTMDIVDQLLQPHSLKPRHV